MIVVTAATKGGASKTTTAVCLAYEASEQGLDAVLVDLDPQGAGAKWAQGLGIPAPHVRNAKDVRDACASHDLAFVDTPPGADPRTVAALEAADVVIVPTGLGPGDIDALGDILRMVEPDFIIPTRFDARRAIHGHGMTYLKSRFPNQLTTAVPSATSVEWAQASQEALPPLSRPAVAYRMILEEILKGH